MDTITREKELLEELKKVQAEKAKQEEIKVKEENFKKFMNRSPDFMIWKAHADFTFINQRYQSEKEKSIFPATVTITGNSWTTFSGKIPVTESTKRYFRNIWDTNYTRYEDEFQKELNKLTEKYVKLVTDDIACVLEMMWLQANHYYLTEQHFTPEQLKIVENEVEKSQAEILDRYSDKQILWLIKNQTGWRYENGEPVPEHSDTSLSHSAVILYRYVLKNRESLQEAFKATARFERIKEYL